MAIRPVITAYGIMSTPNLMRGVVLVSVSANGTMITPPVITGRALLSLTAIGAIQSPNAMQGTALLTLTGQGVATSPGVLSGKALLSLSVDGALAAQLAMRGAVGLMVTASGRITIPVVMHGAAKLSLLAGGSLALKPLSTIVDVWLMNTATGGHARYSNFNYNSFFRIGADYYGCNDTGIYKLSGTQDVTTPIEWDVLSGTTNFGINTRKYVHNARMNIRAAGDVILREIVDEQRPILNAIAPSDDLNGLHAKRIKLPKGVHGTEWQFGISGADPATIRNFEAEPISSNRT